MFIIYTIIYKIMSKTKKATSIKQDEKVDDTLKTPNYISNILQIINDFEIEIDTKEKNLDKKNRDELEKIFNKNKFYFIGLKNINDIIPILIDKVYKNILLSQNIYNTLKETNNVAVLDNTVAELDAETEHVAETDAETEHVVEPVSVPEPEEVIVKPTLKSKTKLKSKKVVETVAITVPDPVPVPEPVSVPVPDPISVSVPKKTKKNKDVVVEQVEPEKVSKKKTKK